MATDIDVSKSAMQGFNSVWNQVLVVKVKIIYDIAQNKGISFKNLLNEFIPEAFEHKELWHNDFILDEDTFFPEKTKKKKKIKFQKKINFVKSLTGETSSEGTNKIAKKKKKIIIKKNTNGSTTKQKKKKIIIRKK